MKSILLTLAVVFSTLGAFAQEDQNNPETMTPHTGWVCEARGQMNTGAPGGGIWTSVYGYGDTQYQASSNAVGQCTSRGLQNCMPGLCNKR